MRAGADAADNVKVSAHNALAEAGGEMRHVQLDAECGGAGADQPDQGVNWSIFAGSFLGKLPIIAGTGRPVPSAISFRM